MWRDGQKKRVFIYRFLAAGTIEEKVLNCLLNFLYHVNVCICTFLVNYCVSSRFSNASYLKRAYRKLLSISRWMIVILRFVRVQFLKKLVQMLLYHYHFFLLKCCSEVTYSFFLFESCYIYPAEMMYLYLTAH